MLRLRVGYLLSGIATGLVIVFSFFLSLPDGRLRIVFCDVGQGDAAYIRFPDGRDMLIDAGPNDKVLGCLGKHMPFWDRSLNIVLLTHPQKDHLQGLVSVFDRFRVDYFVRSDVGNDTEGYKNLMEVVRRKKVAQKLVTSGEGITVGPVSLTVLWPSEEQIAKAKNSAVGELNNYSVVLLLRYGSFDALFPGDADTHVEDKYRGKPLADNTLELLKVPHHGSRTGMTEGYVDWLKPKLAVISVGKNNAYGHPAGNILKMLRDKDIRIQRTDEERDIEVVSDGKTWSVKATKVEKSQ